MDICTIAWGRHNTALSATADQLTNNVKKKRGKHRSLKPYPGDRLKKPFKNVTHIEWINYLRHEGRSYNMANSIKLPHLKNS